jgi:hypothetical protein
MIDDGPQLLWDKQTHGWFLFDKSWNIWHSYHVKPIPYTHHPSVSKRLDIRFFYLGWWISLE